MNFVEITPETLCVQQKDGTLDLVPERLMRAKEVCGELPIVVHGVEMSIGSAHSWNDSYLSLLDRFQKVWPFLWHSEHLSFQTIRDGRGRPRNLGVPLPLPPTLEARDIIVARSANILMRYEVPFLLENAAYYLSDLPGDLEIGDDIGLMNAILERSGCLQLLDLHNIWCNSINFRFDATTAIERMRLDRVAEIHIAGGSWQNGFLVDAHDGYVPAPVWELLEFTLPRTPNVSGVVFEVLEEYLPRLDVDLIFKDLMHARAVWNHHRAARESF